MKQRQSYVQGMVLVLCGVALVGCTKVQSVEYYHDNPDKAQKVY